MSTFDLTTSGSTFTDNGVIYNWVGAGSGAGTGQFTTFLVMQPYSGPSNTTDMEEGFNTDASPLPLGDMQPEHTNAVLLSSIPTVTIGNQTYYQIELDVNEPNNLNQGDPTVVMQSLQLYQGSSGSPATLAGAGTLVYSSGTALQMSDHASGSSTYDYTILVPTSKFPAGGGDYLTLYAKFTDAQGGFEEFGLGQITPTQPVTHPNFTVSKTVDDTSVDAKETLTYTISVANTGDTALHATVTDPSDPLGAPSGDSNSNGVLDAGETWTYQVTRNVTQGDLDQGADLTNTVSVATTEAGSKTATATSSIVQNASMSVLKTGPATVNAAGVISYGIDVTNNGNVTLSAPGLTDANASVGSPTGDDGDGVLDVGETWHYTATRTVSQDDMDAGTALTNTASAASDSTVTHKQTGDESSNTVTTAIQQNASMTVAKTVTESSVNGANQTIHYQIAVTNNGNVTLDAPVVGDANATTLSGPSGDGGAHVGQLDVGETWTYTATHVVSQDEMDHGTAILNTATASSESTITGKTTGTDSSNTVSTAIVQNADIDVVKTLSTGTANKIDSSAASVHVLAGSALTWNYNVQNNGNITLHVDANDSLLGTIVASTANDTIAVGTSKNYTLTETASAGAHSNLATAHGVGLYTAASDTATDTGGYTGVTAGLSIDKKISTDGTTWSDGTVFTMAGQTLYYKVTVTDTASDTGLTDTINSLTDSQHSLSGPATLGYHGSFTNTYTMVAGANGGTNTASVAATAIDAYGNSTTVGMSGSDTVSYETMVGGLSKGYWSNHSFAPAIGSAATKLVVGDTDLHNDANDHYDVSFDSSVAQSLANSSATGDARIILGGQLVAAQLNADQLHVQANGLLEQGARWFVTYGGQDSGGTSGVNGTTSATGETVTASEWTGKGAFTDGTAVSTNGAAWNTANFYDDGIAKVTGEGLKNLLAAFDHGVSGSDGLVVSTDGAYVGWQHGNVVSHVYTNTSFDNVVAVANDVNHDASLGVTLAGISHT